MAKPFAGSVDDYISRQPPAVRPVLRRVRSIIRKAVPAADEGISYKIPVYKLDGELVIFFAAWKEHFSLYPATDGLAEAFAKELDVSKGTIRFPLAAPVPAALIARLVKFRARASRARAKLKAAAKQAAPRSRRSQL